MGVPSHCKMGDRNKYRLSSSLFQLSSHGIWNSEESKMFSTQFWFTHLTKMVIHLEIGNKMYQIWKSTVGWAQLLPQAFVSPVFNVLHPTFCFCSASTNKDLRVHHRSCRASFSGTWIFYDSWFIDYNIDSYRLSQTYVESWGPAERSDAPQWQKEEECPVRRHTWGNESLGWCH